MLDVPDGTAARDVGRECGTSLRGRNALIGNDYDEAKGGGWIDATGDGRVASRDGDATEHAGGNVIGVALDGRGTQDQAGVAQLAIAQTIGNRQGGHDCRSG